MEGLDVAVELQMIIQKALSFLRLARIEKRLGNFHQAYELLRSSLSSLEQAGMCFS